jgi:PTH1 family peptidyl-tRNA hydrolase
MKTIIGLGNSGEKFEGTRHNIGFQLVKAFKSKHNFPRWEEDKYLKAQVTKKQMEGEKIVLGLPQTMMNSSGQAVKEFFERFQLEKQNLWVVHDDKDLNLGELRIVKNSGSAGHKGVESIIKQIETKGFFRFRLGIMTNFEKRVPRTKEEVSQFVLSKFFDDETDKLKQVKKRGLEALSFALKRSCEAAMQRYND